VCVSVVIPILNEAKGLPAFIRHMERFAAEVVFVDGGSTDATQEILTRSPYRWLSAPRGRASQMNAGARATRGDILLFLHADTRLPVGALDRARAAVRDGAVGGSFAVRLDEPTPLLRLVAAAISTRSRITGVAGGDQAMFASRAAFAGLGGFAPMPLFEDVDFSRRLRRFGPVRRVDAAVVTSARRWSRRGIVRTIAEMWALRALYYVGISPAKLARLYPEVT